MTILDLDTFDMGQISKELNMAVMKINRDGDIVSASANFSEILPIEDESQLPDHIYRLSEILAPSDIAYIKLSLDAAIKNHTRFDLVFGSSSEQQIDYNIRLVVSSSSTEDGHTYAYLQHIPNAKDDELICYSSERRFQNFIQNMPNAISYKNIDGKFIAVNHHWNRLFNPTNIPVEGKTIHDFVVADKADEIFKEEAKIIETGEPIEHEVTLQLLEGSVTTTNSQRFPLKDMYGHVVGIGNVHTDTSKHNAITRELNRAKEAAEIANRSKSEFLANMSHELRTPLNAIIGFSEILQNELFGPMGVPSYKEYVDDINDGARHLLEILNDILDMSKVEAGEYHLEEEMFEAHAEVDRCLRFIKERASKHGLTINLIDNEKDPILNADRRVFKQILLNILSNAVKFTENGGTITIRLSENIDGNLEISVSDTGIGIAEDDIPIVLQPFGQADTSLTRQVEGTGLGLSLVQRFMTLHQGATQLESVLDQGTTVYITFPKERWSWDIEELMSRKNFEASNI